MFLDLSRNDIVVPKGTFVFSILIFAISIFASQGQTVMTHISTSDAIDVARKIARDEGYDVRNTKLYWFDLLTSPGGKPFIDGYTTVSFEIGGHPRSTISINEKTGQTIDMNSCEIFDYPDLRPFQENMMSMSKARRKTPRELAQDVGCDLPNVLNKPMPIAPLPHK
jgi:hypothetical protein